MTRRSRLSLLPSLLTLACASASACVEPPEISYETRHLELATDFDEPVCQGTLDYLDDHVRFVQSELDLDLPEDSKVRVYWLEDTLDDWCRSDASGCYYPGTRVVFSKGKSITHEMVHALLNAEAHTSLFIEEGLAELYSGAGSRHHRPGGETPAISELVWLTPEEYRARALDYSLAANFAAWVRDKYGNVVNQRLAKVVSEGGGPEALAYELERLNKSELEELEDYYGSHYRINYGGLRDEEIPELTLDVGHELTLGCDDEQTMGPLPSGVGGMYRVLRLQIREPGQLLNLHLYANEGVRLQLIELDAERRNGNVVDLFMPKPSESLGHLELSGTEGVELGIEPGPYLVYISTSGYSREQVQLSANLRPRPSPHPPQGGKYPTSEEPGPTSE